MLAVLQVFRFCLPFLRQTGLSCAEVHLPLILELEISITEDAHQYAGAHIVQPSLCGAHGDLDLVTGLLIWMF